jgi:hypothetical protein
MLIFLTELNGVKTWATDIGNAYLEAKTSELVYIIASPEFGELEGHVLSIYKALYGLRSSGLKWHEKFSAVMRAIGLHPVRWNQTSGYDRMATYMNMSQSTWTTLLSQ